MKKLVVVGVILLFLGSSIPALSQTNEHNLPSSIGKWLYVGGNWPGNYSRIQDAIDNASYGDTVYVYSGIYKENIVIYHHISLIGENNHTTIIDGMRNWWVVHIMPHTWGVTIQHFTIQNSSYGFDGPAGIILDEYTNSSIISENIFNVGATGIRLYYGNHFNTIKNNTFYKCDVGIQLRSLCHENKIIQNNIVGDQDKLLRKYTYGIYLDHWSYTNDIYDNIIRLNEYGILDEVSGQENDIHHNILEKNTVGIYLSGSTHDDTIYKNELIKNRNGIVLNYVHNNMIQYNSINLNGYGILLGASFENIITKNNITNNFGGVSLQASWNNVISKNNFIKNIPQASFRDSFSSVATNQWVENYWGQPLDQPKVILGLLGRFLPIPWIHFDMNPAKEPYDIPTMN